METRKVGGNNGIDVTVVGLGCNAFGRRIDQDATTQVINGALDSGVTFFDTAEGYGNGLSEEYIGNSLKARRHQVIIATKVGYNMLHVEDKGRGSRDNIRIAIDLSLKRLQTDYVDLYQLHRPDPTTPIEETLATFEELKDEGKIRLYGCSNFSDAQLLESVRIAGKFGYQGFVTAQNKWNVLHREIETKMLPICVKNNVSILPYYPLEMGLLTGKYRRDQLAPPNSRLNGDDRLKSINYDILEGLEAFSKSKGYNLLSLAISWLASRKETASVIAGATRYDQLKQNAEAASWKMTIDDQRVIDKILGSV
ncbi:MAG: aldo/keto reductase [Rhodospirillaceae bacterium]|nr:aldo/keto reductase [Rhodospirillaceae bacterium]